MNTNSSELINVDTIDLSTADGSQNALSIIDSALAQIDDSRADLGALQNRFGHTISNLANISENVSASRSRIQDTDFATETAEMTKNQILQQAGTSILSQANQIPQAAISLLGG
ncbi:flagellin [Pseudoalteromonas sp. SR43-6]|nr:flagellin [Pseudoalteromonas sp. SR41-5]MBB1376503.1 flagellin [Pseudoalteromonas sp. SR43-6]MBB1415637.1 flagellin [Pseudoalteromonas sp. SG43-8]